MKELGFGIVAFLCMILGALLSSKTSQGLGREQMWCEVRQAKRVKLDERPVCLGKNGLVFVIPATVKETR